jgi:hypothetical protein
MLRVLPTEVFHSPKYFDAICFDNKTVNGLLIAFVIFPCAKGKLNMEKNCGSAINTPDRSLNFLILSHQVQ